VRTVKLLTYPDCDEGTSVNESGYARHHVGATAASPGPHCRILFVSHTHDSGVFKVGSHHLVREMARMGQEVAHISTPFSLAHRLLARKQLDRRKLVQAGARVDADGVRHLIPRTLLPAQYGAGAYLEKALRIVRMEQPQYVFVDQPLMLCDNLFNLGAITIYRPTDLYLGGSARRLQSCYIERFDAVAATSSEVLRSLPAAAGQPRTVIPNGVEYSRFRASGTLESRSGAVYVGALDARFDWDAVAALARAHPNLRIALVGPADTVPAQLPANVAICGAMNYRDIPRYLQQFSVGLLPLSNSPLNAGRSPMKLFEYLAAGLHVVARGLPALTARDDLHGCFFYSGAEDAPRAMAAAIAVTGPNSKGMDAARAHDWQRKAQQLLDFAATSAT
jgi:teichuronic acid biosynthesis glycosyltransferase TuaH